MRVLSRAVAVVAATALAVPMAAFPAHAESVSETPSSAAYFSRQGIAKPDASPQAPPNLTAEVDGVAADNLATAAQAGNEDKVSFLYFSLSTVPAGAQISKATMTVPLAPADNANVRVAAAPEKVAACAIEGSGFSTEDGVALSLAPVRRCEVFQALGTAQGEAYVFDVTGLAAQWLEVNDGVALTRDPAKTDTFQVVFTKAVQLTVEYTAVDDGTGTTTDTGSVTVDPGSGTTDLGGATFDSGTGSFDTGTDVGAVDAPIAAGELPAEPAPETAAEQPAVAQPAAAAGPIEMLGPTPLFWLAALLLGGGLLFLSLVLGDPRSASVAAASRPTRLNRALSSGRGSLLTAARP